MIVSGGYPGNYEKGKVISGLNLVKDSIVFHAGTKPCGPDICSDGGRVIAVSSYGITKEDALSCSYRNAQLISFEGMYFRKDLGFDL